MRSPLTVDVMRGSVIESQHWGSLAVVDAGGRVVLEAGDSDRPIFPRSAIKAMQALPFVESGAAERSEFGAEGLALCCSSHNAEQRHLEVALGCLSAVGATPGALECGPQLPERESDRAHLHLARGEPTRLHNNCSGKHAGFIAFAAIMGHPLQGYSLPSHPVQREVKSAIELLCCTPLEEAYRAVDGCSIPTYAVPLRALAHGFARFGSGEGLGPAKAASARQLIDACTTHPFLVAGTNRFCTQIMSAFKGRVFVKTGAEGVFCGYVPELGYGIALKCLDGAKRAAEAMMAATLSALLSTSLTEQEHEALNAFRCRPLYDRNGNEVGEVRCQVVQSR